MEAILLLLNRAGSKYKPGTVLLIVIVWITFVLPPQHGAAEGFYCFKYYKEPDSNATQPPNLPPDATIESCSDVESCMKVYAKTIDRNNSAQTLEQAYQWDCEALGVYSLLGLKCGDTLETGVGGRTKSAAEISYTRTCTCCGNLCNSVSMDTVCNEEPKFTRRCYSGFSHSEDPSKPPDPKLPSPELVIPCTESQVCMKTTSMMYGYVIYEWGCASLAENTPCGWSNFKRQTSKVEKICTCCGDLCNGHSMDSVTANNSYCGDDLPPDDGTPFIVIIISSSLGALTFLSLIALAIVIVCIFRIRVRIEQNKQPDRVQIVQDEFQN